MNEGEWKNFLDNYYFLTYYHKPIGVQFVYIAKQFETYMHGMSSEDFRKFLDDCRQYAANFERVVDDLRFGTELDIDHARINGKNSAQQNANLNIAYEKGYTRIALDILSAYMSNMAWSFGFWLSQKYKTLGELRGSADLVDLYLTGTTVKLLRSLRKDYVIRAYRYGYSNKSISEATRLECGGIKEETVKDYTEDKESVNNPLIGEYYPLVDFDMTGIGRTKVPCLPPADAPSERKAKQTVDMVVGKKEEFNLCAQKMVEDFRLKALRYKNVEINLTLHPNSPPLLDIQLDLLLISSTIEVLNEIADMKRDTLLAHNWTKNSLSRLMPGGKTKINKDGKINNSTTDKITRSISQINTQSPSGLVRQEHSSGSTTNLSVTNKPALLELYEQVRNGKYDPVTQPR